MISEQGYGNLRISNVMNVTYNFIVMLKGISVSGANVYQPKLSYQGESLNVTAKKI